MTLRTKLLWQFAPPLLLVLGLTFFATHNVLLERLDKQDERLLVSEAKRVRALLNNLFERDADRLEQLAESLPRPIASAFPLPSHILNRTDFDFLALVTPTGQRSAWRTMAPVFSDTGNSKPLSFESLQSEVSSQLGRLSSSMASASSPQLMVVHRQPFILATVDVGPPVHGKLCLRGVFSMPSEMTDWNGNWAQCCNGKLGASSLLLRQRMASSSVSATARSATSATSVSI